VAFVTNVGACARDRRRVPLLAPTGSGAIGKSSARAKAGYVTPRVQAQWPIGGAASGASRGERRSPEGPAHVAPDPRTR
jgi:hypothetical protein